METVHKTITLTERLDRWVKGRIATGEFADDSAYICDLIRRDEEENAGIRALEAAIQEGLDSGISDKTVPEIMEEVEARLRAEGRL